MPKRSEIFQFEITAPYLEVEATGIPEARKLAEKQLEHLSGSNDGSELLANAVLEFRGSYVCDHVESKDFTYNCETKRDGVWCKLRRTITSCTRCKKTLNETEVRL